MFESNISSFIKSSWLRLRFVYVAYKGRMILFLAPYVHSNGLAAGKDAQQHFHSLLRMKIIQLLKILQTRN